MHPLARVVGKNRPGEPAGSASGPLPRVGHEGWGCGQLDPGSPRAVHVLRPPAGTGLRGGSGHLCCPSRLGSCLLCTSCPVLPGRTVLLRALGPGQGGGGCRPVITSRSVIDGGLGAMASPPDGQPGKQLSAANGPLDKYDRGGWGSFQSGPAPSRAPKGRAVPAWQAGLETGV